MKRLLLYVCVFLFSIAAQAQNWKATNLTNVIYLPITSMETHNGELYATVFNGFTGVLSKMNQDQTSWTVIPTGDITVPRFLASAETRLYMSSINSGVFSLLYYTKDKGAHFILDTAGLPKFSTGVSLINGLQYFNGKVIANLGGGGYFLKDTSETKWKAIPVATALNGGVDPITCLNNVLYAYDNTGTNTMYYSTNWGASWDVRTTDLPTDFGTNKLAVDESLGRIYAGGAWNGLTQTGLYYSDNKGANWTQVNLSSFIGTMPNNNPQQVTAIYSEGSKLFVSLENRQANSAPDILSSTSGVNGLAYDTLGLPASTANGVYGVKFVKYNDQIALSLVVIDVYLKGGSTGVHSVQAQQDMFSLYPNPANETIHILNDQDAQYDQINVYDIQGKCVFSSSQKLQEIDVNQFAPGLYCARFLSASKPIAHVKFIRE